MAKPTAPFADYFLKYCFSVEARPCNVSPVNTYIETPNIRGAHPYDHNPAREKKKIS